MTVIEALNSKENFQSYFSYLAYLVDTSRQYPEHADALIGFVLLHPEEIKRLTGGHLDNLHKLIEAFPGRAQELQIIASNQLQTILSTLENFQSYFAYLAYLVDTSRQYPEHADALIGFVLSNPEELGRLTGGHLDNLHQLIAAFPRCTILQKQSVQEVKDALYAIMREKKSRSEIEKNVTILFELHKVSQLPTSLMVIIAAMTGNWQSHNEQAATEIAYKQNRRCELDAALPSLATMINHHRLLDGLNTSYSQEKTPEQQHEFDKRFGLTIITHQ